MCGTVPDPTHPSTSLLTADLTPLLFPPCCLPPTCCTVLHCLPVALQTEELLPLWAANSLAVPTAMSIAEPLSLCLRRAGAGALPCGTAQLTLYRKYRALMGVRCCGSSGSSLSDAYDSTVVVTRPRNATVVGYLNPTSTMTCLFIRIATC